MGVARLEGALAAGQAAAQRQQVNAVLMISKMNPKDRACFGGSTWDDLWEDVPDAVGLRHSQVRLTRTECHKLLDTVAKPCFHNLHKGPIGCDD